MISLDDAKLKDALISAYRGKHSAEPGRYWETRVMNHIRSLGPLNADSGDVINFIWRFAASAGFLVLILSVYLIQTGSHQEYEMAELLVSDLLSDASAGLAFLSYFGNII